MRPKHADRADRALRRVAGGRLSGRGRRREACRVETDTRGSSASGRGRGATAPRKPRSAVIVYLDSSTVLRVLLRQRSALSTWGTWERAYASELMHVETRRALDRLRV